MVTHPTFTVEISPEERRSFLSGGRKDKTWDASIPAPSDSFLESFFEESSQWKGPVCEFEVLMRSRLDRRLLAEGLGEFCSIDVQILFILIGNRKAATSKTAVRHDVAKQF